MPVFREQGYLPSLRTLKDFNAPAPSSMLAVVDFTEIQDVTLNDLVVNRAMIFNDTPVAMFFPVLEPALLARLSLLAVVDHHKSLETSVSVV